MFGRFPQPYDPRFNPLSMIRLGTAFEEEDAFELAGTYVDSDGPQALERRVQLAGIMRVVLRTNPAATLADLQAACDRLGMAWIRGALGFSSN